MNLSEAIELFLAAKEVSPKTRQIYKQVFGTFPPELLVKAVDEITIHDLRLWSAEIRARSGRAGIKLSPQTHHIYLRNCKTLFNWLVSEEELSMSPAARLAMPRLPKVPAKGISDDDLDRLLKAAHQVGPRNYALVLFLAETACRVGGAISLTLDMLDLPNQRAIVLEKGRKARTVWFSQVTTDALRAWLVVRSASPGVNTVFVNRDGQPLTRDSVYSIFRRLAKKGNVEGRFNPHSLRHAWARRALLNGLDLGSVSQILGHSSTKITHEYYGFWDDGDLPKRHKKGQLHLD